LLGNRTIFIRLPVERKAAEETENDLILSDVRAANSLQANGNNVRRKEKPPEGGFLSKQSGAN
jgi:hypothetical protein